MTLLIDAGNTRTKWVWLQSETAVQVVENGQLSHGAQALQADITRASEIWISNVAGQVWRDWFQAQAVSAVCNWITSSDEALGVHNGYSLPAQLGTDRWCSLLAVWQQQKSSALVVSAGTALTIDCLLALPDRTQAQFVGGSIQPGLQLMWRSLQQGAAQLDYTPPPGEPVQGFACNTRQAMWQGCMTAMTGAITWHYGQLSATLAQPPALILSGGDAALLAACLPSALSAQAVIMDNLVLSGLAALAATAGKAR